VRVLECAIRKDPVNTTCNEFANKRGEASFRHVGYIHTPEWDSDLLTYAGSHGFHVTRRRCSTRRNYADPRLAIVAVDVA
jgi:hypothetical protein